MKKKTSVRACRVCGCTDDDCSQCIAKTGSPCHWVEDDLCSACVDVDRLQRKIIHATGDKRNKRNDIAIIYAEFIKATNPHVDTNCTEMNKSIIDRWSNSGLIYIKELAWKIADGKKAVKKQEHAITIDSSEIDHDCYMEGYRAWELHINKKKYKKNPYQKNSTEWQSWNRGWNSNETGVK